MDADPRYHAAHGPSPEELFPDWPALRPVDRLLEHEARTHSAPAGLTERVFRASVARLPQHAATRTRQRSLLLQPLVSARFAPWGRLAMAASIAAAFVLAMQVYKPAPRPAPRIVMLSPDEEIVLMDVDSRIDTLFAPLDAMPMGAAEQIVLTREMTFRDLADDVLLLASDMEM